MKNPLITKLPDRDDAERAASATVDTAWGYATVVVKRVDGYILPPINCRDLGAAISLLAMLAPAEILLGDVDDDSRGTLERIFPWCSSSHEPRVLH